MRAFFLALVVATPVLAQPATETPPPPPAEEEVPVLVDPLLVGTWTLDDVDDMGTLDEMGADVEAMVCTFSADGEGHATMTLVQDLETFRRERAFEFETEEGAIVTDDDDQPMRYRFLEDGRLEIRHPLGLTLHLARAAE